MRLGDPEFVANMRVLFKHHDNDITRFMTAMTDNAAIRLTEPVLCEPASVSATRLVVIDRLSARSYLVPQTTPLVNLRPPPQSASTRVRVSSLSIPRRTPPL